MATIHKLSADVINRIAAGEVVQRPSAALKELLENAIDADCSRVQVLAADGGLEVLQVSDDGSGIHKEDLPLLCERYATSKLNSFEDLRHVTSFGFRGEALASISYVSRVTVTTRRRSSQPPSTSSVSASQVAWRAQYLNGSLTSDPQPCAGNPGTTIRAEKLFYNALVRRNALRASEEWGRIVDVVSRYALAYPKIGFTCQRDQSYGLGGGASTAAGSAGGSAQGGNGSGVIFPPHSTTRQNIRLSHGSHVVSHLRLVYAYEVGHADEAAEHSADQPYHIETVETAAHALRASSSCDGAQRHSAAQEARVFAEMEGRANRVRAAVGPAGEGLFTLVGYTSDPTLVQRKPYLCLFINQRLVESTAIRKAIDGVYSGVLTGGNRPFTVLFLTVPTDRLDVNVHPTKKEVFLLDEELVVARVSEVCRGAVLEAAAARQMDMLKMRHTTALALKQLPLADGSGAVDGDASDVSGSSSQHILEKLRDQYRRGAPMASPLTSASVAAVSSPAAAVVSGPAVVVSPCTMVRVEPQKGALDRYFSQRRAADDGGKAVGDGGAEVVSQQVRRSHLLPASSSAATPAVSVAPLDVSTDTAGNRSMAASSASERDTARHGLSSTDSHAAPSWDAVMVSLHRSTASAKVDAEGSRSNAVRAVTVVHANPPHLRQSGTEALKPSPTVVAETGATATEAVVQSPPPLHQLFAVVKRERHAQTDTDAGRQSTSTSADSDNAEKEEEEEEEDRMREFKRHRQDVYKRMEALQRGGPTLLKTEKNTATPPMKLEEGQQKEQVQPSQMSDAEGAVGAFAPLAARSSADELNTMARLGAVVHASDLLRDEAAAAAKRASAFTHVVSSSEESDVEVEQRASCEDGIVHHGISADERVAAGALVAVAEVEAPAVLSSVTIVVDRILASTSLSAAALVEQLTYVGAVDARAFLAQVGTTLVWCDTLRLVRHVVFQRIFLRWGQPSLPAPSVLEFDVPLPLYDLLAAALAYDAPHLQPPSAALLTLMEDCDREASSLFAHNGQGEQRSLSRPTTEAVQRIGGMSSRAWRRLLFHPDAAPVVGEGDEHPQPKQTERRVPQPKQATRRYIRRLVRRLCRWRGLLKEYFFVDITSDGLLLSVPHGLNQHWPPLLRALPLTVWQLAEDVPYPSPHVSADAEPSQQQTTLQAAHEQGSDRTLAPASTGTRPAVTQTVAEAEADGVAQEVACFTAVARHLADTLYGLQSPPPPLPGSAHASPRPSPGPTAALNSEVPPIALCCESWQEELVQHGLFPSLKNAQLFRLPDQCLRDGTIQSMVSVESLYKVFERC